MNFDGENTAGHVSTGQSNIPAKRVLKNQPVECAKLMLPGKAMGIAIGLRNDGDEDETFQFAFQALIHLMNFQKAIMWIRIEVNRYRFFDGGGQFLPEGADKISYPVGTVIVVAVRDEENSHETRDV